MADLIDNYRDTNDFFRESNSDPRFDVRNQRPQAPSIMSRLASASNPMNMVTRALPQAIAGLTPELSKEVSGLYNDPQRRQDFALNRIANYLGIPVDMAMLAIRGINYGNEGNDLSVHRSNEGRAKPVQYGAENNGLTSLPSDPAFGSSEYIKELLKHHGLHSGDEEHGYLGTAADFAAPFAVGKLPNAAMHAVNSAEDLGVGAKRFFTPVTATLEGVAPDLGQLSSHQHKGEITNRLIGGDGAAINIDTMAGQPTTSKMGHGAWKEETNPMLGVNVPNINDLSKANNFKSEMNQIGSDLNQEAMAAHRFIPTFFNNARGASSALIKPKSGELTAEQFARLNKLLGDRMIFTHNPELGGAVVFPYGSVAHGDIAKEMLRAKAAANRVLGEDAAVRFGRHNADKDLMYTEAKDYGTTPRPEVSSVRDMLKQLESQRYGNQP